MNWEAANAPQRRRQRDDQEREGDALLSPSAREKQRSTETVEAALSRLSKAYTLSMECIGALNKTNAFLAKEGGDHVEALAVVSRVSRAARASLEKAILLDPLVLPHASTLHETMHALSERDENLAQTWSFVNTKRPTPPTLSSAAHKSTVRELTYLALVNYSDLLQSCCCCSSDSGSSRGGDGSLLDRGVVKKVSCLVNNKNCSCSWEGEAKEDTQRLAVTALCDASNLDGSDPTLWLKMACASRCLERIVHDYNSSPLAKMKHRRLQRYALEQGSIALPPGVPRNRAVQRALQELLSECFPDTYEQAMVLTEEAATLTIELPRYSWSVLGRLILRACREGSDFGAEHKHHVSATSSLKKHSHFGSPCIVMRLSPMLTLPSSVLGRICLFLDNSSIWRFEATCRALSVSIISARATLEDGKVLAVPRSGETTAASIGLHVEDSDAAKQQDGGVSATATTSKEPKVPSDKLPERFHRSSQRLRSQQITSGKKAERSAKRRSFEYCFLAATAASTVEQHRENMKKINGNESVRHLLPLPNESIPEPKRQGVPKSEYGDVSDLHRREARERVGDSSLSSFVDTWSNQNSGPMDLLVRYLAHVSINAEDIFASDPGGTVVLTSCILSCFETYFRRAGSHQGISPRFFKPVIVSRSLVCSMKLFAVDLLYGELMLRQCDRYSPEHVEFDDDSNLISLMLPELLEACEELDGDIEARGTGVHQHVRVEFKKLKTRCNWLAAGFFLWRSRIAQVVWEAREAEDEGIAFIEKTSLCCASLNLKSSQCLRTPHLVSPSRPEAHWKEISPNTLRKFRDEIQASSVVSHVREKFQDLAADIEGKESDVGDGMLSDEEAKSLGDIGERLFNRYKSSYGSAEAKHAELVDDFLSLHGDELVASVEKMEDDADDVIDANERLNRFVPLGEVSVKDIVGQSNPSTLSMLVLCLNVNNASNCHVPELLVRLLLTTKDMHGSVLQRIEDADALRRGENDDTFSDSDSDSLMSEDSSDGRNATHKSADEKRARQCGYFVVFLLGRLSEMISSHMTSGDRQTLVSSKDCGTMIQALQEFSSGWFKSMMKLMPIDDMVDQSIFRSTRSLVRLLCNEAPVPERRRLEQLFFNALVRTTISHRYIIESLVKQQGDRSSRSAKQKLCLNRAGYIAVVACEVGFMLSNKPAEVADLEMVKSELLVPDGLGNQSLEELGMNPLKTNEVAVFHDAVLVLWKYASQNYAETSVPTLTICSPFDRPVVKKLKVPIAIMVVGLCGAATSSRASHIGLSKDVTSDSLCLTEFFDSDSSANDWLSVDEDEAEYDQQKRKELLRSICHAVHSIGLVVDNIDDKGALSYLCDKGYGYSLGPLFPLATVRALNFFADTLLQNFHDDNKTERGLWSDSYPISTRTTGELLDGLLHKAYRWLYGFSLVGEKSHQVSTGKDLSASVAPIADIAVKECELESTSAAAQLYRSIVRAYAAGRRSPPKAALELVASALPPLEESEHSTELRRYLFDARKPYFRLQEITHLVAKGDDWKLPFQAIHDHLDGKGGTLEVPIHSDDEVLQVRRGILSELASGPLPVNTADSGKHKSDASRTPDDERSSTMKNETEITKKFEAILDNICLGDIGDCEGWYRASQCLNMKAELIADRLGVSKGFSRYENFTIPTPRPPPKRSLELSKLLAEQSWEDAKRGENWAHHLGRDLSVYTKYTWSSFSSLRACADEVGKEWHAGRSRPEKVGAQIWEKIESMYHDEDYIGWQEAWGGIFVLALRKLAVRFLCVALYRLQVNKETTSEDKVLISELCESLGIILYTDLMSSQNYGFPMHEMSTKRKRELAQAAQLCFNTAADVVDEPTSDDHSNDNATWDLLFMTGKCEEKIAGTYTREAYQAASDGAEIRRYEAHMISAIENYSTAYAQAKKIEEDGGFIAEQSGGSAHGCSEVLYRLLALRLKCLISAVSSGAEELESAEEEALRLTEKYWYKQPEGDTPEGFHTRDRVWRVLVDVVAGLAQCRVDHNYFHRSVYRHAQALMWSPLLYDPTSTEGSLGSVPATRSYQIRGLNNSTPAAHSAQVVMSSLFEKKRSQLCAVWVTTTPAPSPFQILNNSTRKYDALRGKYAAAYLECLRLCHRRSHLETFLKWTAGTRRDVPSYFQASASERGGVPSKPHSQDSLLVTSKSLASRGFLVSVKRAANSAFADVLLHELSEKLNKKSALDDKKWAESYLKHAYACFLRLHATKGEMQKTRAWRFGNEAMREVEVLCQAYLATEAESEKTGSRTSSDFGDWSGGAHKSTILDAALARCRVLFPSLSGNFFTKKPSTKSKKASESLSDNTPSEQVGAKRKEPSPDNPVETTPMSYEVAVPSELSAGDTFLTTVKVGSATKKLKLTVPPTNPSTLRFTLQVPKEGGSDVDSSKKDVTEEEGATSEN